MWEVAGQPARIAHAPGGLHDVPSDRIAAVVTSLEMKSRPAVRPELSGPWRLQRASTQDAAGSRSLSRALWEDRRRVDLVLAA